MSDKIALITGGSSGLGFEMARYLGKLDYKPIILARNKAKLDNATEILNKERMEAEAYQCDVSDENQIKFVFDEVKKKYKKIDFLILNAGVVKTKLLSDYEDSKDLKYEIDVNVWGTVLSAYIFCPLLVKGSRILMISSGFGLMGAAGYSIYAATKAGIINFAEALRRELLCKDISVHVACPGDIDTPQYRDEHKNMPQWMRKAAPRSVMHPQTAASKIIKKCFKNKFLIIIHFEVHLLIVMTKLMPKKVRDAILDKMFPRPKKL